MECTHYDSKGCHLVASSSQPSSSAQPSSPSKRTRSNKGTEQSPAKNPKSRSTRGKKKSTDHEESPSKRVGTQQSPSKKTKTTTLQWKRCRAKKISNDQRTILTDEFAALFAKNKDEVSFLFAERSMQEYAAMQKSPLHINARNVYRAAIGQVMCQVVSDTDKPLDGNASKVFECLWPVCQKVSYYC